MQMMNVHKNGKLWVAVVFALCTFVTIVRGEAHTANSSSRLSTRMTCQTPCTKPWPHATDVLTAINPVTFNPWKPSESNALYNVLAYCCDNGAKATFCTGDETYEIPDSISPSIKCAADQSTARVHFFVNNSMHFADQMAEQYGLTSSFLLYSFASAEEFRMAWNMEIQAAQYFGILDTTRDAFELVLAPPFTLQLGTYAHMYLEKLQPLELTPETLKHQFARFFNDFGVVLLGRSVLGCRVLTTWYMTQAKVHAQNKAHLSANAKAEMLFWIQSHGGLSGTEQGAASWFLDAGFNRTKCMGGGCMESWKSWVHDCSKNPNLLHGDKPLFVDELVSEQNYPGLSKRLAEARNAYLLCGTLSNYILPLVQNYTQTLKNAQPTDSACASPNDLEYCKILHYKEVTTNVSSAVLRVVPKGM